jgi:hypothetical protein
VRRPDRSDEFGCRECYRREDAGSLWAGLRLGIERGVVGDSHFIVQLRYCAACGQRFAWVCTELVDWTSGDDAQYRDVVPLDNAEADRLAAGGEDVDLQWLGGLGADRRCLRADWPTGTREMRVLWVTGPLHLMPGY